jgi:hypothetical protein
MTLNLKITLVLSAPRLAHDSGAVDGDTAHGVLEISPNISLDKFT